MVSAVEHHNCHEHQQNSDVINLVKYSELSDFNLLLNLLIIAIIGSFTHCAAMCGPIAGLLSASKMLNITGKKLNNWSRIKASFNFEYIIGKAITYSILAASAFILKEQLKNIYMFRLVAFVILMLTAVSFISAALYNFNLPIFKRSKVSEMISRCVKILVNRPILKKFPRAISEVIRGMALGLIPCGFLYSSIVLAVTFASNILVASIAMFFFGIATSPALIVASFLGAGLTFAINKIMKTFLFVIYLLNAVLLISYALKVI